MNQIKERKEEVKKSKLAEARQSGGRSNRRSSPELMPFVPSKGCSDRWRRRGGRRRLQLTS